MVSEVNQDRILQPIMFFGKPVPRFQLLQWKYALKLQKVGIKMKGGRTVTAHINRNFDTGKRMNCDELIALITETLNED